MSLLILGRSPTDEWLMPVRGERHLTGPSNGSHPREDRVEEARPSRLK